MGLAVELTNPALINTSGPTALPASNAFSWPTLTTEYSILKILVKPRFPGRRLCKGNCPPSKYG
jgi:hypothetical protein